MRKNKLLLLLALLLTAVTGAWAEEQVVYTLDGTQTASNNNYATAGVVNQDGITWRVTGNVNMNPWRIGGKSLSGVDRSIWSESSLDETVTKVTLEFGTASSITVNSITMTVAGDDGFSDVIDTKAVTFSANNTVDVTPTEGKEWKNAYYRFVFNVTVEGSSNKFLQLKSIKFYNDPDAQQQGGSTEPVAGTFTVSLKEGTVDAGNWSIEPKEGLSEGDQVTIQYNGRLKVKGVKATSDAAPASVPVTAITLNKTATTITKISGTATETLSVTAVTPDEATDKTYTWSSANTDVATVDAEGKVTAVAEGTAHIRATANDGSEVYGECTVTVLDLSAYYSKMTSCGSSAMDQIMKLRDLGKGRTSYNSSLTAAQAWELAKYRATVDGKTTYVIMSSQNEGYEIHYALSTDAAATEHTSDVDDLVDYFSSTILNMYYIAQ